MTVNRRVLVVDDSPTIRKLVEIALRGTNWLAELAPTGKEAIAAATAAPPDAILLDFVLPDMRGVDVCARLAREKATSAVPLVLMTAKEWDQVKGLFAPYSSVVGCLSKPFTAQDLLERLASLPADGAPRAASRLFAAAQQEQAARALFAHMKTAFAQIPSWLPHMGSQAPAAFFARKILTPETMDRLLQSLEPIYREALAARNAQPDPEPAQGAEVLASPMPAQVLDRARGFSERIRLLELNPTERRVLALVDGRSDVYDLASRTAIRVEDTATILQRFIDVGLLIDVAAQSSSRSLARPVLIREPDIEGFQKPLASLLRSRPEPVSLVDIAPESDVVDAIRRERPKMVILNASAAEAVGETARAVRAAADLGDVALVAVLDPSMAPRARELSAAGFDAVLFKPVAYRELERFLDV